MERDIRRLVRGENAAKASLLQVGTRDECRQESNAASLDGQIAQDLGIVRADRPGTRFGAGYRPFADRTRTGPGQGVRSRVGTGPPIRGS